MKKTLIAGAVSMAVANVAMADKPSFQADDEISNVHNRCIVQFNDNVTDISGKAKGLAKKANSTLRHVYKKSLRGFTVNTPCHAAAKAFKNDASIKSLTPDSIVFANRGRPGGGGGGGGAQQTPYGITRVGGAQDGTGYTAWVIDTGIDVDHPDLNVDAASGFSAFTKGKDAGVDDGNGHGTHVAGTIAAINNSTGVVGVAAGATVVPIKVLGARGTGSNSGVIAGVEHAANNAQAGDCVNMSLGGGVSSALDQAVISAAQSSGAYFVLAAGNDAQDANNSSPARANGNRVFTISASDENDNFASFSNYGSAIDYAAPGVRILSTYKGGGTASLSGTSMASPLACGVIMLSNGNPGSDGTVNGDPDGNPDPIIHL